MKYQIKALIVLLLFHLFLPFTSVQPHLSLKSSTLLLLLIGRPRQSVDGVAENREDPEISSKNHNMFSSNTGKGKKVKYQLVEYHSLPPYMRDIEFILCHYRFEWPLKQVFLSIFSIHNETLNAWTHLIGFFLLLSLTIYTSMKIPKVVDLHHLQHIPEILKKAHLHKLQRELLTCLPSVPNMPDLHRFREELKTAFPAMDALPPPNGWHIMDMKELDS